MRAPTVLIASGPAEGEWIRRALEEGGFRGLVSDGSDAANVLDGTESLIAVVMAAALFDGSGRSQLGGLLGMRGRLPVILIDEGAVRPGDEDEPSGIDAVLARPIDAALLVETVALLSGVAPRRITHSKAPPPPAVRTDGEKARGWLYEGAGRSGILRVDDDIDDFARTIPNLFAPTPRGDEIARFDGASTLPGHDLDLAARATPLVAEIDPPAVAVAPRAAAAPSPIPAPIRSLIPSVAVHAPQGLPAVLSLGGSRNPVRVPFLIERGDLADVGPSGLPGVIDRLHRGNFTGRLTLRRGEAEKTILFQSGRPASASSNLPHDQLADLLLRERRITRADVLRWRAAHAEGGDEALVRAGLLDGEDLVAATHRQAAEIFYSCFAWERGTFEASREASLEASSVAEERLHGHPYALVLEGIRRHVAPDRLFELVGPPSTALVPQPGLATLTASANLDECELRAVARLGLGVATVADLAIAGGLTDGAASAIAWALLALGGATRAAGLERARILDKWAQVCIGDYFALLEITPDAAPEAIQRAWRLLRDEFARRRCAEPLLSEFGDRLDEIAAVLDEARRVLADDAIREAYRARLADPAASAV